MFDCIDLPFWACCHGFWSLMDEISHLEDQWPSWWWFDDDWSVFYICVCFHDEWTILDVFFFFMEIGLDGRSSRNLEFWDFDFAWSIGPAGCWLDTKEIQKNNWELNFLISPKISRLPGRPALLDVDRIQRNFRGTTGDWNDSQTQKSNVPGWPTRLGIRTHPLKYLVGPNLTKSTVCYPI